MPRLHTMLLATLGCALSSAWSFAGSGSIYWTNFGDDNVRASNGAGTRFTTLASGLDSPFALTASATHLYWSDDETKMIRRSDLDGSNPIDFVRFSSNNSGSLGDIEVTSEYVFWTQCSGPSCSINSVKLDGSAITRTSAFSVAPSQGIGATGSRVFFPAFNSIWVHDVRTGTNTPVIEDLENTPSRVEVFNGTIYWCYLTSSELFRCNLDGTGMQLVADLVTSIDNIAVDENHLYWIAFGNAIQRSDLSGGNITELISERSIAGLAVSPFVLFPELEITKTGDMIKVSFEGLIYGSTDLAVWIKLDPQPQSPWIFTAASSPSFYRAGNR